ncbi:MAG: c-type cytochrome [Cytophagales bacterium]|nr:c-type cytochrome [Cytophagales bacterium]MDW8384725.1 cbb3-type cytochrome c oxidase N-terminal domain-containing protein [Flammeovirgaceae bacterium]
MKKLKIIALLLAGLPAWAQTSQPQTGLDLSPEEQTLIVYYAVGGAFLLILLAASLLVMATAISLIIRLNREINPQPQEEQKLSWWERFNQLKPLSKEKELLLEEEFDGILELNNPIPFWFNVLFYGTIFMSIVYLLVYHVWDLAPLQAQEYEQEVKLAEIQREEYLKKFAASIDETNVEPTTEANDIVSGKQIYMTYCAACHGQLGEGKVGPNLTDKFWLHGGDIKSLFKTIKYGVPEKGMISWQKQLNPLQIRNVASYILTLQGTNPPNAKAPEGTEM